MSLAKAAMLVSINVINGGLLGERRDPKASHLVTSTYGTAERRTKASKYLIDRQHVAVKRVVAASQRVREVVYRYTLPWGNDKTRLLPIKTADEFKVKLGRAIADLDEVREEYINEYPQLVAASQRDLMELFDARQYPDIDRIRDLFRTRVTYWPMPESNNFIAEISKEAAKAAKQGIENEIEERLIEATYDMVRRAREVVSAFVDKLESYKLDEKGKPEVIFRDSIVDNISDTANLIDRMNLTGNAQINKVIKDLKRIVAVSQVHYLRKPDNETYRARALTAGQEVLINLTMLDLKDQEVSDMVSDTSDYMDL